MPGVYLETNAIRTLTDYKYEGRVYTSVFALFELISGIRDEKDFFVRKANIKKVFDQKIEIDCRMVDQALDENTGNNGRYSPNSGYTIYNIAKDIILMDSYKDFLKAKVEFMHDKPIFYIEKVFVLEWLKQWDDKISQMVNNMPQTLFDEDKNFMKEKYKNTGVRGFAEHYWKKFEYRKYNEGRMNHASVFCTDAEINKVRESIDKIFSLYNFKLFMVAQAVIFAKAYYIDGGRQDKNNPSDLLHLLYLKEGDCFVSGDKIYNILSEAIDDFHYKELKNKKKLSEILCEAD